MPQFIAPLRTSVEYLGRAGILGYDNHDGRLTTWNCGQAAVATLLTSLGVLSPSSDANLHELERRFPPDVLWGWLGTSRCRVHEACAAYGVRLQEVRGEERLQDELRRGNPVVVMLGVSGGRLWKWDLPGGHWMVAYGFDQQSVYLTNWGEKMSWDEFHVRWRSLVSRGIRMNERGLAARC